MQNFISRTKKRIKKIDQTICVKSREIDGSVGNGLFFNAKAENQKETIQNSELSWFKFCNAQYRREDGSAWEHGEEQDATANEVIPFSLCSFWNEEDWEEVACKPGKWKRLQKRRKTSDEDSLNMDSCASPSQQRRGRKPGNQTQDDDKDESRPKTERTSNHNYNHNKHDNNSNNNSNNNYYQVTDEINLDASLVQFH